MSSQDLHSTVYIWTGAVLKVSIRLCNIMLRLYNIIDTYVLASTSLYSKTQFNNGVVLYVSVPLSYQRQQRIKNRARVNGSCFKRPCAVELTFICKVRDCSCQLSQCHCGVSFSTLGLKCRNRSAQQRTYVLLMLHKRVHEKVSLSLHARTRTHTTPQRPGTCQALYKSKRKTNQHLLSSRRVGATQFACQGDSLCSGQISAVNICSAFNCRVINNGTGLCRTIGKHTLVFGHCIVEIPLTYTDRTTTARWKRVSA